MTAALILGACIPARSASDDEGEQEPAVHSFQRARLGWAEGTARTHPIRQRVEFRGGSVGVGLGAGAYGDTASGGASIGGAYLVLPSDTLGIGVALDHFSYEVHHQHFSYFGTPSDRRTSIIAAQLLAVFAPVHLGGLRPFVEVGAGGTESSGDAHGGALASVGGGVRLSLPAGFDVGMRGTFMLLRLNSEPGQFRDHAVMLGGFAGWTFGGDRGER